MVRVDLPHIHRVRRALADGSSVEYHSIRGVPGSRFWRTGDSPVGSPEYVDAYRAAGRRPTTGATFGAIITAYLDSGEFRALAPRTQRDYRQWADRIRTAFGDAPLAAFERPAIRAVAMKWRDRWSGKQAAYGWTVLRLIAAWAYDSGRLQHHHLRGGGRGLYRASRAEIVWTGPEVETFTETAPDWLARALVLATETGLRPGDIVKLTRAHVRPTPKGRQIYVRTGKSRGQQVAAVPVTARAAAIIDATPPDRLLILVNEAGTQLSEGWLSKAVRKHCRRCGLGDRLRLYDARGTAVTRLLRAGASVEQMAQAFGWRLDTAAGMIRHYAALDPGVTDDVLALLEAGSGVK